MMDHAERELFAATLAEALGALDSPTDEVLAKLGWTDALEYDPYVATSTLFELQGQLNLTSAALDAVIVDALNFDPSAPYGVVLPPLGSANPPGIGDDTIDVHGLALSSLADRTEALIGFTTPDGGSAVTVVPTSALELTRMHGIDPSLGLHAVRYSGPVPHRYEASWVLASSAAQIAIGHEIVGAASTMVHLAREHALERIQFDRPISTFQAVRHRLAEAHVAVESSRSALDAAWRHPSELTATMSKVIAGRSAKVVGKHAQQVLAGIGFTTEHPFHRFAFRTMVLDKLFGDARSLTAAVGARLVADGELPAILPL